MRTNSRLLGLLGGLLAGLLLVLVGWKILLILLGFALVGYVIGVYFESGTNITTQVRDLIARFLRS
ncbi:hypothetical protein KAV67_03675 [Candidatus Bipolaricaulota bacterium]|jgi:uncharacterized membrane protein|nr:hypothetical protein [Candidatus Bipolaricaulota bacterium]MCK4411364.1 hypothetical protein [Candidatus Bipolaricaulota bacterium]